MVEIFEDGKFSKAQSKSSTTFLNFRFFLIFYSFRNKKSIIIYQTTHFFSIAKSSKSFIKANSRSDVNRKKSQPKIDRIDSLRGSCSDSLFHETFGPLSNVRFVEQKIISIFTFSSRNLIISCPEGSLCLRSVHPHIRTSARLESFSITSLESWVGKDS